MTAPLRPLVEELVYEAALRLDAGDFAGFLALCDPRFRYRIGAFSPEIRRPMVWLDHDREGLGLLFETLPRHNSDHARLTRHVTLYTARADPASEGREAAAVSALQVFRTGLDGGATELFAAGKIHDRIRLVTDGGARLLDRRIELETRRLGIGSHIPF
jgi:methanesulfonate monooxygenase subunit beta